MNFYLKYIFFFYRLNYDALRNFSCNNQFKQIYVCINIDIYLILFVYALDNSGRNIYKTWSKNDY